MSLDSIELAGRFLEASGLPVTAQDSARWLDQLGIPVPVGWWTMLAQMRAAAIRAGDEGYRIGLEEQRCGSTG